MRYKKDNKHIGTRILMAAVTTAAVAVVVTAAVLSVQGKQHRSTASPSSITVTGKATLPRTSSSGTVKPQSRTAALAKPRQSAPQNVSPNTFKGAVFMGDSVTVGMMNFEESAKAAVVGSIGASSYRALTCHTVAINGNKKDTGYLPDRVAAAHPQKVYMMFGSNDLEWGAQMSPQKFTGYYGKLIDAVHSRCPKAKIYVQSILPITKAVQSTKAYPFDNKRIDQFNAALKAMCRARSLSYLDVASVIKGPDGCLPANESDDGLHPRSAGYHTWFRYLASHA